ncbi:NEDD8-activating enzyme E1 regulatory subunit [Fulvia fulva]|uniref:NEDD8-activating enzyme E1 regulatory subunit n=1 Tax=Passalora fulva TaxID=5499 RepID=A0A9Q8USJ6_PASFU|nr:NEDD8-activating enzyme E1 regulatory subunit [Fulvia fulva]KAK4618616.1 NEDD8-activating enzyme E1 regulatory subunit [Fulvia fulva]UJO20846.1 NEDD8-activating enzyme E1 regulatory subunit [Fulvia fulva]WPV33105.1 NEDD8-activating enzyme E1 regulatory subunit [Fulvia fulva]
MKRSHSAMANSQEGPPPPPLQDVPTAKEKKYDRQLRLWGTAGQIALEETHILLINNGSGVTGVEALKNLVLPGIGHFTILDSGIVSEADLGVNFFLHDASLGKYRAEETVKLLQELNPDVKGHAITEPIETWASNQDALKPYTLIVVAAPIDPAILYNIQNASIGVPIFYIHSVGFYSQFSVSLPPDFPIVDTHPDPTATTDLRLLTPWQALSDFARQQTTNMDKMNGEEFAHIPYVCLLLHYLEEWKTTHAGKLPLEYKEKTEFRNLVRTGSPSEENFDEACAAVLKSLNPPTPERKVLEILNAPEAQQITVTSAPFWVIANAVSQFYQQHNELPLPGAVPDMKARSNTYIELQNIYKAKAREDANEVLKIVRQTEQRVGRSVAIDEKEVDNFCKGAAHIALVRGSPFKIAQAGKAISFGGRAKGLTNQLQDPESMIHLYLSFQAWDEFVAFHTTIAKEIGGEGLRIPGAGEAVDWEEHAFNLFELAMRLMDNIINQAGTRVESPRYDQVHEKIRKTCTELARAGGAELHNIASLSGGLIAQEVIKVITKQYVPINNTCVFDGITSKTGVFEI